MKFQRKFFQVLKITIWLKGYADGVGFTKEFGFLKNTQRKEKQDGEDRRQMRRQDAQDGNFFILYILPPHLAAILIILLLFIFYSKS